ncbi:PucR family transcriptional regulator [Leucobacter komagatae]|uniref:PucR family transcriptional regulator n=1 Tax=Leucobacter komagatae TaxID=55969 RepID=A0A0D0H387_9MICO|nr:PucR family transcriptional regulator [Leucobacter komagatae]KIP51590.1 PucR family transcriptional regulator [Leucobacter komagatae]
MALTIQQVLEIDLLQESGPRVLTGEELLQRDVSWVHSSEIPDIARFLRGGELLLTAGLGIGATARDQRRFISEVAAAGAAALVIEESGRMFTRVPEAVVDAGREHGLPVIALEREVPFAGVSSAVHSILSDQRVRTLTREREVETIFSELLLMGADSVTIAQTVADVSGCDVVVENVAHRVVAYTGSDTGLLAQWSQHTRSHHIQEHTCVQRPILMRGQPWGYLHVFPGNDEQHPLPEAPFAADRAAAAIAISMLTDRSREARERQRSAALVSRLLLSELTGPGFVEQARRLGYQLNPNALMVAVANKEPGVEFDTSAVRKRTDLIAADMGEYALVVSDTLGSDTDIAGLFPGVTRGIGVSRQVDVRTLATAFTQARSAASVLATHLTTPVLHFDSLGVERILIALAQGPELASFVEDELGPLLEKDANSSVPLLPTLRAFLEVDGRKSEAANRLFIQRRTLYNRLVRLTEILGRSLEDPASRQSLLLAVKGLDLLSGR